MNGIFIFKTLALSTFIFLLPVVAYCQGTQKGSLEYLLASNGFKQIKLGESFNQLDAGKLAYMDNIDSLDADSCYKFCYKDDGILDLGNGVYLNQVGFRTYKGKIVNIYLFFPRECGYSILKDFEANYGRCTNCPGEFMYDWKANGVTLSLRYKQAIEMGVAIFTSKSIEKQLVADNNQRKVRQEQRKNLLGAL